jgi:hypothetical protein
MGSALSGESSLPGAELGWEKTALIMISDDNRDSNGYYKGIILDWHKSKTSNNPTAVRVEIDDFSKVVAGSYVIGIWSGSTYNAPTTSDNGLRFYRGVPGGQSGIFVKNIQGTEVPPFGLMQVTGIGYDFPDGTTPVFKVKQCTTLASPHANDFSIGIYTIANDGVKLADGATKMLFLKDPFPVLYDSTAVTGDITTGIGTIWDAADGTWKVSPANGITQGLMNIGQPSTVTIDEADYDVLWVTRNDQGGFLAVGGNDTANESVTSTGSPIIWHGDGTGSTGLERWIAYDNASHKATVFQGGIYKITFAALAKALSFGTDVSTNLGPTLFTLYINVTQSGVDAAYGIGPINLSWLRKYKVYSLSGSQPEGYMLNDTDKLDDVSVGNVDIFTSVIVSLRQGDKVWITWKATQYNGSGGDTHPIISLASSDTDSNDTALGLTITPIKGVG